MQETSITQPLDDFVGEVRQLIAGGLAKAASSTDDAGGIAQLMSGKMLRTRMGARLAGSGVLPAGDSVVQLACAATELAHTASLCHDDVIDGGAIRRSCPALWKATSTSAAVLIGDLLLCEAMDMLLRTPAGRHVGDFIAKLHEVVATETRQELSLRNKQLDEDTCLELARGKTGPLFAFVGRICGGDDGSLSSALEEAGYRIGTAYQLADDLLDVIGSEDLAGKTLGTDSKRQKFTLAQVSGDGRRIAQEHVFELCSSALDCVSGWPWARQALREFLTCDVQPVFQQYDKHLDLCLCERLAI